MEEFAFCSTQSVLVPIVWDTAVVDVIIADIVLFLYGPITLILLQLPQD